MLRLSEHAYLQMIGHAYDCLPEEACSERRNIGGGERAPEFYPCRNDAASSKVYTVNDKDFLAADRAAQDRGHDIVGVMHSHTHTDAYPSPTDVRQAVDPNWHYVIVSLKYDAPVLRSYHLVDGKISEEPVVLDQR